MSEPNERRIRDVIDMADDLRKQRRENPPKEEEAVRQVLDALLPKEGAELTEIRCAIAAARKLGAGDAAQAWMDRLEAYLSKENGT